MLKNRYGVKGQFDQSSFKPHHLFSHVNTLDCIETWNGEISVDLPNLKLILHNIDYLELPSCQLAEPVKSLHFQQDTYRLWYQIDGFGILQNATQKTFGSARPGLLGIMDRGERYRYLHQRGHFACFQMLFTVLPSLQARCYWNSVIEGKTVLEETERLLFENYIDTMFYVLSEKINSYRLVMLSKMLEIIIMLFNKSLIIVEESRFPKNKAKSLVTKAKNYIDSNYSGLHHQDDLEKECGVDINYLNILFKKETGRTLYHYLTCVRMEHAKYLLETTLHSISDIAARSGYSNANSFCRAFKRIVSLTPQEFRCRQNQSTNHK